MSATRTQVYFSPQQRDQLDALAKRDGKTLAAVVREAVDAYVGRESPNLQGTLDESFASLPDFEAATRSDWDRGYG
jgi:predicted transcriptional regulator